MKKKFLAIGMLCVAGLALASGCSKEKRCRCSVLHSTKVRVITVESGNCEDLRMLRYHTELDSLRIDSLICTDHEFERDK